MAVEADVVLGDTERLAGGDPELVGDEVTPVVSSVTGCSTWSRVFISRNVKVPRSSSRNSHVPALT